MENFFNVGDTIHGFCNGYFGRDDYDSKICVMVNSKYAIFQYLEGEFEGNAIALNYPENLDKESVEEWKRL